MSGDLKIRGLLSDPRKGEHKGNMKTGLKRRFLHHFISIHFSQEGNLGLMRWPVYPPKWIPWLRSYLTQLTHSNWQKMLIPAFAWFWQKSYDWESCFQFSFLSKILTLMKFISTSFSGGELRFQTCEIPNCTRGKVRARLGRGRADNSTLVF